MPVSPHVGAEFRTVAPRVYEEAARLLRHEPPFAALSPTGQTQLLTALARAVDEFARLVEDRPSHAPAVETMLVGLIRVEGQPRVCRAALHAAFHTIREMARVLWPQLPHARSYSTQLDTALAHYAERLCTRALNAQRARTVAPTAVPTGAPQAGDAPLEGLLALAEHRWGTPPPTTS